MLQKENNVYSLLGEMNLKMAILFLQHNFLTDETNSKGIKELKIKPIMGLVQAHLHVIWVAIGTLLDIISRPHNCWWSPII